VQTPAMDGVIARAAHKSPCKAVYPVALSATPPCLCSLCRPPLPAPSAVSVCVGHYGVAGCGCVSEWSHYAASLTYHVRETV